MNAIDVWDWELDTSYTDEPFPAVKPWDGIRDIDMHKLKLARLIRCESARRNKMLLATDSAGRRLYTVTEGGQVKRVFELSKSRKRRVRERDGYACVWCGATEHLEVDHIVRYRDGGSNDLDNLRTFCHSCHIKRGGRP